MEVANNLTGYTIINIRAHSGNSKLMVTLDSSLAAEVFALRGERCEACRSERDLRPIQVRFPKRGGRSALDCVVECETCITRRLDVKGRPDRDDWYIPFGRWKDHRISECPRKYLGWLRKQEWLREPLRRKITKYLLK